MMSVKAQLDRKIEDAAIDPGAIDKALERLRDQRNYLAGAAAGLARLLPDGPVRHNLTFAKRSGRQPGDANINGV